MQGMDEAVAETLGDLKGMAARAAPAPIPENEQQRLAFLYSLQILDTPPEPLLDKITGLAVKLFKVGTSVISFTDAHRQWMKSMMGFAAATEVPRNCSICAHLVMEDAPQSLVLLDASKDPKFKDNPFVAIEGGVRFYASTVLVYDNMKLGTLCLVDTVPREQFSEEERRQLMDLAALAVVQLKYLVTREQSRMEYITSTTHNLRTPLYCLELCLNTLQPSDGDDETASFEQALLNLNRMKCSVEKAISTARSHNIGTLPEPVVSYFRVDDIIKAVLNPMVPLFSTVPIYFKIDAPFPDIIGTDEVVLNHILVDLLCNACKWTKEGSITLKFSARFLDVVEIIKIEVIDTGCGIDPSIRHRIFKEPFVGDSGFGLGCYNVRRNISFLGGECGLEDNFPNGTRFWIQFPNIPSKKAIQHSLDCSFVSPLQNTIKKLLIIEDNLIIRRMTLKLLQKLGHHWVDVAVNGMEGLEMLKKCEYDLVFCDYLMPHMNGFDCVRAWREWQIDQATKMKTTFIGMSANELEEENKDIMDEFWLKPLTFNNLKHIITKFFQ
eukprot:TRINITY_DN11240_c0_g2_i1.p1 TRINITY_DN11240_c0_g2~~TRINITY_DN11240_c0_g2_i1.p1  ORF type:complete len:552 (-),score=132.52 TRINITY_DN11240_c0_g2_i1:47-1702(-)